MKEEVACWFNDVMFLDISNICSLENPNPDICWKNACFSTWTVMLWTPASRNIELIWNKNFGAFYQCWHTSI